MRRVYRIPLIAAAVAATALLALPFLIDANQFRPPIEAELTKTLGRTVTIGNLKLGILSGKVTASDLSIADDPGFSQTPFLHAKAFTLSIDVWQVLLSRKLKVDGMTIQAPDIVLIQNPSGAWNFSSLGAKSPPPQQPAGSANGNLALPIKLLRINGARLAVTQGRCKPWIVQNAGIEVRDFAPGAAFPFTLSATMPGGGNLTAEGKAGPLSSVDAADTPLTANLKIANWNLAASGAVPGSGGIDGVFALDGAATSNGSALAVTGQVKAEKLKLAPGGTAAPNPLLFDFALTEDLRQHSGLISRGDIAIGGVKASLTGTWTREGESAAVNMILSAPSVPVSGLMALLPPLDVVLPAGSTLEGGTATANLTITGPLSAAMISGPVSLRNTRLNSFDLGAKMSPIEKLAGLKSGPNTAIQTLTANLLLSPRGTSLRDIHLALPSVGELTGGGTIGPGHVLDFRMSAALRAGAMLSPLTPPNIPFSVSGTSSNPLFQPEVGKLAAEEITRGLQGVKTGGVDSGKAVDNVLQGLFGGKKK